MDTNQIAIIQFIYTNIVLFGLKYVARLVPKANHFLKTIELDNFSNLRKDVLSGKIKNGDNIHSYGQFSRYGHVFKTLTNYPVISSLVTVEITEDDRYQPIISGLKKSQVTANTSHLPVSTLPGLPIEGLNVGFLYPGNIDSFFLPINPDRDVERIKTNNKNVSSGIPVITKEPLGQLTEEVVEFNLTVVTLPYNIVASLLHLTKEDYTKLETSGGLIVLMDINDGNYIKVREDGTSNLKLLNNNIANLEKPKSLKGTLYLSIHLEYNQLSSKFEQLCDFYRDKMLSEYPNFDNNTEINTMEIFPSGKEYKGDRQIIFNDFGLSVQKSGNIFLVMPVDYVNDYYAKTKVFNALSEKLVHMSNEFTGNENYISVDFIHDYDSGLKIGNQLMRGDYIEELIRNKNGLREIKVWLENSYKKN